MPSQFTCRLRDAPPKFDFVGAHFACERNRYTPDNPGGFVNFGSAQNQLNAAELQQRLAEFAPVAEDAHYQPFAGTAACRESIAASLGELCVSSIHADDLVVGNGVISLLEALTIALLDEGDSILIPTPVFPGLVAATSLRVRSAVSLWHTPAELGFRVSPSALATAVRQRRAAGERVRAVLLCSPGNPVGQVFGASEIDQFVGLAERLDFDLVVDEVYAASCFEGVPFHSALSHHSRRVYVLGGLSKDFGLAGHATGWLHGRDEAVMRAVAKQAHFFRLPAPVQRTIEAVLDRRWREPFVEENRRRLTRAATVARRELESMGVVVSPGDAGLCLWLDLRPLLAEQTGAPPAAEDEMRLYHTLLEEHRVHLSPGAGFHCPTPGFFRLCFSQEEATLAEGLLRLRAGLESLSPRLSAPPIEEAVTI